MLVNFTCAFCGKIADEEFFSVYHSWKTGEVFRSSLYDFCSIECLRKWINELVMDKGLELIPRATWTSGEEG